MKFYPVFKRKAEFKESFFLFTVKKIKRVIYFNSSENIIN